MPVRRHCLTPPGGWGTALISDSPTTDKGIVEAARKGTWYSFTQNYGYDHLNRLSAASDTVGWTQNFSCDRYGNSWTTTNTGLPPDRLPYANVYNAANNQSSYPGTQYDADGVGNQTRMGVMQLTFDAENRITHRGDLACHVESRIENTEAGGRAESGAYAQSA